MLFRSNSQKKSNYDQFGHAAFENGGGGAGGFSDFGGFDSGSFSNIFDDFFGDFRVKVRCCNLQS